MIKKLALLSLMFIAAVSSAKAFDWTLPRKAAGAFTVDYNFSADTSAAFNPPPWTVTVTSKVGGCPSGDVVLISTDFSMSSGCPTAAWSPTLPSGLGLVPVTSGQNPMTFGWFSGGHTNQFLYKIAGGSEPSSYIFTLSANPTGCSGSNSLGLDYGIACISGANATTPLEKATELEGTCAFGNSCTVGTTSITTTKADIVVPAYYTSWNDGWTSAVPSGFTALWNFAGPTGNVVTNGSYSIQSAAGATSPSSVYSGANGDGGHNVSWLVTLTK